MQHPSKKLLISIILKRIDKGFLLLEKSSKTGYLSRNCGQLNLLFYFIKILQRPLLLNLQSGYITIDTYGDTCLLSYKSRVTWFLTTNRHTVFFFRKLRKYSQHSNHSENNIKASNRNSHYLNVGKLLRLNTYHFKSSLFLVFICVFWSLNCNMNGLRHNYFSLEVVFYNYYVRKQKLPMLFESVVKNNWNGNFSDFINFQGKKQVWHILSNSAKVAGFITCNYIYMATFKQFISWQ